jgi:hypothetical protein
MATADGLCEHGSVPLRVNKTFSFPECPIVLSGHASYSMHTYLLAPWSRVLLEKLTISAASQEILRIFGTRIFLTVPTIARHLSLS